MDSKILLTLIALLGLSTVFINQHSTAGSQDALIATEFAQWQNEHGIFYGASEQAYRFSVFRANYLFAQEFNAKQTGSLRLGMTPFASMSNEEFAQKMVMKTRQEEVENTFESMTYTASVPTEVNWTAKGAVTPVENQGQCGSCWAFSTKESLESIYQIRTGHLEVLSAQQLVSCARNGNEGCNGGWPLRAMQYTHTNGIQSNKSYPYTSGQGNSGSCHYNSNDVVFRNTGEAQVRPSNNAAAIQENVARQPLSILVQAASITWQLYRGGVMDNKECPTQTDHAVLLTGYDSTASTPFWRVRNSWGTSWGESGYCRVEIIANGPGICGIQQSSYYPEYSN